ncbi:unnamed protein product [Polarella glacialis]|uniref:Uncharacterized protein n=1 Tax=Polarella glacialis TaxID=89957 RepID=A0A813HK36_POLGL|nr:unnamed protein product [Polarella glacialis]CAE8637952.1 unnamed protein product [Polarella glacialis]CAE8689418.1 unnamed protein product [Polarella glacialis]
MGEGKVSPSAVGLPVCAGDLIGPPSCEPPGLCLEEPPKAPLWLQQAAVFVGSAAQYHEIGGTLDQLTESTKPRSTFRSLQSLCAGSSLLGCESVRSNCAGDHHPWPTPETDSTQKLVGAACWGVVTLQAESDMLRTTWWFVVGRRLEQLARKDKLVRKNSHFNGLSVLLGISLAVESLSALAFIICTWRLMRASTTVQDKIKDCAGLSIIVLCDETLLDHLKFEPIRTTAAIDPCKLFAESELEGTLSRANKIAHRVHDATIVLVACGMMLYLSSGIGSTETTETTTTLPP